MLDDLLAQPAFALIRVRDADTVTLVGGPRTDVEAANPIEVPVGSKLLVQIQGLESGASLSANNASKRMEMLDSQTQRLELEPHALVFSYEHQILVEGA